LRFSPFTPHVDNSVALWTLRFCCRNSAPTT
jgi:hypothetical protein